MEQFTHDIANAYRAVIYDTGKQPQVFLLLSFLLSFGFIRTSQYLIKHQVKWWPGVVETESGLHIHHLVWGIFTMMLAGYLGLAFYPESPWREGVAVLFGIGMGLTLDEFALWLYLKDVYWAPEGRDSIDAVITVAAIAILMLLGFQFWIDIGEAVFALAVKGSSLSGEESIKDGSLIMLQAVAVVFAVLSFLKHKFYTAIFGLLFPFIGFIGATRLAKPNSRWAKRYYSEAKLRKAEDRFPEVDTEEVASAQSS